VITPAQALEAIANAYNPNSPLCRFRYVFYNMVSPTEARPPPFPDEKLWQQVCADTCTSTCVGIATLLLLQLRL
jgi:nuclear pore complex protein Nup54